MAQDVDTAAIQAQIDKLQKEIEVLKKEQAKTTAEKESLQKAIKELDLQIQTLQKSISLTSTQIGQKDKEIVKIGGTILTTEEKISLGQEGVAATLRHLNDIDDRGLVAAIMGGGTLSDFFDEAVSLGSVRNELGEKIEDLNNLRSNLAASKNAAENKRKELAQLKTQLSTQQKGVSATRSSQTELLKQTQNKEAEYQALIAQKQAEQKAFEAALFALASSLGTGDISQIPAAARGILRWPLDNVVVTQEFGRTSDSGRLYVSGTHDGMDFSTRSTDFPSGIGTPVRAALGGTVYAVNQGAVAACQYGKWVLIKHDNGLATLYAHLSSINVSQGARVSTGSIVGASGNTGYATGPHLHFTVYAAKDVSLKQYTCRSGYTVTIPIAPTNAYLNPRAYLP